MGKSDDIKIKEAAERAGRWVASDKGKRKMEALLREMKEATVKLSESRRVDEKTLQKPVTR